MDKGIFEVIGNWMISSTIILYFIAAISYALAGNKKAVALLSLLYGLSNLIAFFRK